MGRSWPAQLLAAAATVLLAISPGLWAQRIPKPGFNLFSKEQDIQLGKEGAAEIEKQVNLVDNREVNDYIQSVGRKLAAAPEADSYPYSFKVVFDESINAFALPGGPTYVHTGLILAAENEAQLAGVLAHEISHVALRHGTNQASKANLIGLGAMLGGGLIGGGSLSGQLAQLGIGFGANSVLLKFSRSAERDADVLGVHIMAHAGYNPIEMARFFEKLEAETGRRSGVAEFFSSHPNPGNRMKRVEEEIRYLPRRSYITDTGQLARVQNTLRGLTPPPKKQPPKPEASRPSEGAAPAPAPRTEPSARFREFRAREFSLSYPENWQAQPAPEEGGATFAPPGGIVQNGAIGLGALARFRPVAGPGIDLERAAESLIEEFRRGNPTLRDTGRRRRIRVDGAEALTATLESASPFGGTEMDLLVTVAHPRGLFYVIFAAPQQQYAQHQAVFERMLASVRLAR
jgi:Zn-dependent protease with chaperone function